jgi:hypothetical protein
MILRRRPHRTRAPFAWLAVWAFVFAAIAPTVAVFSAERAPGSAFLHEICTADGSMRSVAAEPASGDPVPASSLGHAGCPLCFAHAPAIADIGLRWSVAYGIVGVPPAPAPILQSVPQTPDWSVAGPRAPPRFG